MTDAPWSKDTVSLVEAYRRRSVASRGGRGGPRRDRGETQRGLVRRHRRRPGGVDEADVSKPFGGIPISSSRARGPGGARRARSVALSDLTHDHDGTLVGRLRDAGRSWSLRRPRASSPASTRPAPSSTGPPATPGTRPDSRRVVGRRRGARRGGVCTLATAGDGGGSTRIPARSAGCPGSSRPTAGSPGGRRWRWRTSSPSPDASPGRSATSPASSTPSTASIPRDPYSLPRVDGWEHELGTRDLRGLRVAVSPNLGTAVVRHRCAGSSRSRPSSSG